MLRPAQLLLLCAAAAPALSAAARGVNTWYSFLGPSNETETLLAAAYQAQHLLPFGYDSYTLDEGWAEANRTLLLDGNGLPTWNPALFPSGLPALAARLRAQGLTLGVWLMRGIPRAAVQQRLPIAGSPYTCDQAARLDRNCSWSSHTFGANGSPAAAAYYASLAARVASWGVGFVKMDCLWPHLYEGTPQTYFNDDVAAATAAFAASGATLSLSPGISVSPENATYLASGARAALYRIAEDVLDVYDSPADGTFPQGVHQKFAKALEFESFLGLNGTYPDFDMLQVGRVVHSYDAARELPPTETRLTPAEQQSQFALFCFTGVPLVVGGRLPLGQDANGTATLALLTQRELLAVHNASASRRSFAPSAGAGGGAGGGAELYGWAAVPAPAPSARYVGVFSAGPVAGGAVGAVVRFAEDAGVALAQACVRDLATGQWLEPVGGDVGGGARGFVVDVPPHGSRALLVTEVGAAACRVGLA